MAPWAVIALCTMLVVVDQIVGRSTFFVGVEVAVPVAVTVGCLLRGWYSAGAVRAVWCLLGVGMGFNAVGDILFLALGEPADVSLADAFFLLTYPFLLAAVAVLIVARAGRGAREVLFDTGMVAVVTGLAIWQYMVVNPGVSSEGSLLQRVVFSSYPMAGSLLVTILVGLLLAPGRRRVSLTLTTAFAIVFLASDTTYNVSTFLESERLLRWSDGGYVIGYGILLAAAMHPSASDVCARIRQGDRKTSSGRLALIGMSLLGAPALASVTPALGFHIHVSVYFVAAAAVSVLAVARIGLLVRNLERERGSLKAAQSALSHQASHDGLTGLPNRARMTQHLEIELARARAADEGLAILFVDLDRFKQVNDTLGHPMGDLLLVHTAERLRGAVREDDLVARIGGDEFVVVCPRLESISDAQDVAARILKTLHQPFDLDGRVAVAGASMGLALLDGHASAADLIRDADIALYRAKASGRGVAAIFEPSMAIDSVEQLEPQVALAEALQQDELSTR